MKHIFEKSKPGRTGVDPGPVNAKSESLLDAQFLRKSGNGLPELSELDVVRHYILLSKLNFSVDSHFYPLGSCTMKYNPKINEVVSALPGLTSLHPFLSYIDEKSVQGAFEILHHLEELLCEITGMARFTTHPYAGAHGELAGILLMAAYHKSKGNKKKYVIVPESAHGTNPASAAMGGYEVITIPVDSEGEMDLQLFSERIADDIAGIMITLPNTLGLFHHKISKIIEMAHQHDALVYNDGANLNAILGKMRPGDIGVDIVHINLHKTFSTPHGGGGPGSGMVGISDRLTPFLPLPSVRKKENGTYGLNHRGKDSIGPLASFLGNFLVMVKAYTYILMLGKEGLIDVAEKAVLNANYIRQQLKKYYYLPYDRTCMHECVFSAKRQMEYGIHANDIAKALIDRDIHPPTIYFPLVVEEALMIEPTETESKETLDNFIEAMIEIAELAETEPERILNAPQNTPVLRPDQIKAARELKLVCE